MKKLLGAALSLALLIPSGPASAELLKNLKVDGSLEVQAVSARNVSFLSTPSFEQIGDAQTRLLLNAHWDLLEDVHSTVSLTKNNRIYGQASENLNLIQTNVLVDQANIKIDKLIGNADAKIGRQFFG